MVVATSPFPMLMFSFISAKTNRISKKFVRWFVGGEARSQGITFIMPRAGRPYRYSWSVFFSVYIFNAPRGRVQDVALVSHSALSSHWLNGIARARFVWLWNKKMRRAMISHPFFIVVECSYCRCSQCLRHTHNMNKGVALF